MKNYLIFNTVHKLLWNVFPQPVVVVPSGKHHSPLPLIVSVATVPALLSFQGLCIHTTRTQPLS